MISSDSKASCEFAMSEVVVMAVTTLDVVRNGRSVPLNVAGKVRPTWAACGYAAT